MDGISYNQTGAKDVTVRMGEALGNVKNVVESEWNELITTFQNNWVGEDEAAFENVFAKTVVDTFENCQIVVNNASAFIIEASNAFAQFQSNISDSMGGAQITQIEAPEKYTYTVELPVSTQTFAEDSQRGLQNASSADALTSAIQKYAEALKNKISEEYSAIDMGTSFVGEEQRPAMASFVHSLGESIGNLLSSVDAFINETIPELVAAYNQQQKTIGDDASTASQKIAEEVSQTGAN